MWFLLRRVEVWAERVLDDAGNDVYAAGATELSGALRVNTTLTSLGLGCESRSYRIVESVDVGLWQCV